MNKVFSYAGLILATSPDDDLGALCTGRSPAYPEHLHVVLYSSTPTESHFFILLKRVYQHKGESVVRVSLWTGNTLRVQDSIGDHDHALRPHLLRLIAPLEWETCTTLWDYAGR